MWMPKFCIHLWWIIVLSFPCFYLIWNKNLIHLIDSIERKNIIIIAKKAINNIFSSYSAILKYTPAIPTIHSMIRIKTYLAFIYLMMVNGQRQVMHISYPNHLCHPIWMLWRSTRQVIHLSTYADTRWVPNNKGRIPLLRNQD